MLNVLVYKKIVTIFNGKNQSLVNKTVDKKFVICKKNLSFFADFFFCRKGIWFTLALVKYFVKTNLIYSVV